MAISPERKAYLKVWCEKNRERVRESKRRYRERKRLGLRLKARDYWHNNEAAKERARARRRTPEGKAKRRAEWERYKNSDKYAERRLRQRCAVYGISVATYESLLETQGGLCAVCRSAKPTDIDHHHGNGTVRGLLCRRCNSLIGYIETNGHMLDAAHEYLRRGQCRT